MLGQVGRLRLIRGPALGSRCFEEPRSFDDVQVYGEEFLVRRGSDEDLEGVKKAVSECVS